MSNLETAPDETQLAGTGGGGPELRLLPARDVPLGGVRGISVSRLLPQRELPTVGAWCFLDVAGPTRTPADILPHPHIGLQTVTWPLAGRIRHRDTLGNDVEVQPGELNLMTSGRGIAHSEFTDRGSPALHFLQLWIALPESRRDGAPDFDRYLNLPELTRPGLRGTVLIGELAGVRSPAAVHTPLVGADLTLQAGCVAELSVQSGFEHALFVIDGDFVVDDTDLEPGPLYFLGIGRSGLRLSSAGGARVLLLGGEPFDEDLVMWWNFVGRSHQEIAVARADWEARSSRFGEIPVHGDLRIPAPPLPAVRLTARRRRSN